MGDFIINLLNFDKHAETTSFVMLHAHSFVSPINRPTWVTKNSATLLDNTCTNNYCDNQNTFQWLIYTDVSVHFPILYFEMRLCHTDTAVTRRNLS